MSRNEDIDNGIWSDPDFDALSPDATLLYLWSFTNPRCGMAGLYKVPRRHLLEGKLPEERLVTALAELSEARFAFYEQGVLWVRTRVKFLRTKGDMMRRSIANDLGKIPSANPLLKSFCEEYKNSWISAAVKGFDKGSEGVPSSGTTEPKVRTPREPLEGSQGKGKGFLEWLEHFKSVTAQDKTRGSAPARKSFNARVAEGYSVEELKLATIGCHSDDFLRENGHVVPVTILRASKVDRYIQMGRAAKSAKDPLAIITERAA